MTFSPGDPVEVRIRSGRSSVPVWVRGQYDEPSADVPGRHWLVIRGISHRVAASDIRAPREKPAPKRKAAKRKGAKPSPHADYLAFVRSKPCLFADVTLAKCSGDTEPHHWPHRGSTGTDDRKTVPLCNGHHIGEWHGPGETIYPFSRDVVVSMFLEAQVELLIEWTDGSKDGGR